VGAGPQPPPPSLRCEYSYRVLEACALAHQPSPCPSQGFADGPALSRASSCWKAVRPIFEVDRQLLSRR